MLLVSQHWLAMSVLVFLLQFLQCWDEDELCVGLGTNARRADLITGLASAVPPWVR